MNTQDIHIFGPVFKGLSLILLCYMVMFKQYRVPIMFFVLYGIGSVACATYLISIKQQNIPFNMTPAIYEQYLNVVLCFITVFYIFCKKKMI